MKKGKLYLFNIFSFYAVPATELSTLFDRGDSWYYLPDGFSTAHIVLTIAYILAVVALVFYMIHRKKMENRKNAPKLESIDYILTLFRNVLDKNMTIEASFLREGKNPDWKIHATISSITNTHAILTTNLSTDKDAKEDIRHVFFTKPDLKLTFAGRFSVRRGLRYILNTFETKCTLVSIKNGDVTLKMKLPQRIVETQRRDFPRVQVPPESLKAFVLWNLPENVRLLSKPPSAQTAIHVSKPAAEHVEARRNPQVRKVKPYTLDNISGTGLKILLGSMAAHNKKLHLANDEPALLLISIVKRSTDEAINLWLIAETKVNGLSKRPPMLGCVITAWAYHPAKGQNFQWNELDEGKEVPPLTQWVAEELFAVDKAKRKTMVEKGEKYESENPIRV